MIFIFTIFISWFHFCIFPVSLLEDSDPDEQIQMNKSNDIDSFNKLSITQRFFAQKTITKSQNKDISSAEATSTVQNQDTAEVVKHSLFPRFILPKAIPIHPPAPLPPSKAIRKIIIKSAPTQASTPEQRDEDALVNIKKEQDEDMTNIKKEQDLIISKAVSVGSKMLEKRTTATPVKRKSQNEYPRTRSQSARLMFDQNLFKYHDWYY